MYKFQTIMRTVVTFRNGTHGTFNSNKIYFALIIWLIEYKKELAKITVKSKKKQKKQGNRQRQIFQISILNVPKRF